MFITPYFGGCKYTNKFLFINKNIEFQHFVLLITFPEHKKEADLPGRPPVPFSIHPDENAVLEIIRYTEIHDIRVCGIFI